MKISFTAVFWKDTERRRGVEGSCLGSFIRQYVWHLMFLSCFTTCIKL